MFLIGFLRRRIVFGDGPGRTDRNRSGRGGRRRNNIVLLFSGRRRRRYVITVVGYFHSRLSLPRPETLRRAPAAVQLLSKNKWLAVTVCARKTCVRLRRFVGGVYVYIRIHVYAADKAETEEFRMWEFRRRKICKRRGAKRAREWNNEITGPKRVATLIARVCVCVRACVVFFPPSRRVVSRRMTASAAHRGSRWNRPPFREEETTAACILLLSNALRAAGVYNIQYCCAYFPDNKDSADVRRPPPRVIIRYL